MRKVDDAPDCWVIKHNRAYDYLLFGPFETLTELAQWMKDVGEPNRILAIIIPVYKTVDWNRPSP